LAPTELSAEFCSSRFTDRTQSRRRFPCGRGRRSQWRVLSILLFSCVRCNGVQKCRTRRQTCCFILAVTWRTARVAVLQTSVTSAVVGLPCDSLILQCHMIVSTVKGNVPPGLSHHPPLITVMRN